MLDAGDSRHGRVRRRRRSGCCRRCRRWPSTSTVCGSTSTPRALDDLDAAVLQHVDVDAAKPVDLLVLGGDQARPIEASAAPRVQPKPAASAKASANCAP